MNTLTTQLPWSKCEISGDILRGQGQESIREIRLSSVPVETFRGLDRRAVEGVHPVVDYILCQPQSVLSLRVHWISRQPLVPLKAVGIAYCIDVVHC